MPPITLNGAPAFGGHILVTPKHEHTPPANSSVLL